MSPRYHINGVWCGPYQQVTRCAECGSCSTERRMIIRCPKLELTRDPPTGDPLPLPTERQWMDGMTRQRG